MDGANNRSRARALGSGKPSSPVRGGGREDSAKSAVSDQITQAIQSTSNLLHLLQNSSPSNAQLTKLPKNLIAKASTISNTAHVLEQMPQVISSYDTHLESGIRSVPHMRTVSQLLENIDIRQFSSVSYTKPSQTAVKGLEM